MTNVTTEVKNSRINGQHEVACIFRMLMQCGWTNEEIWKYYFKPWLATDLKSPLPEPANKTPPEGLRKKRLEENERLIAALEYADKLLMEFLPSSCEVYCDNWEKLRDKALNPGEEK